MYVHILQFRHHPHICLLSFLYLHPILYPYHPPLHCPFFISFLRFSLSLLQPLTAVLIRLKVFLSLLMCRVAFLVPACLVQQSVAHSNMAHVLLGYVTSGFAAPICRISQHLCKFCFLHDRYPYMKPTLSSPVRVVISAKFLHSHSKRRVKYTVELDIQESFIHRSIATPSRTRKTSFFLSPSCFLHILFLL